MNAISRFEFKRDFWHSVVMLTLGFWLSASLVLDWVIMPSLYISGMMVQSGFATAGYVVFWNFNRMELLAAAIILTGVLVLSKTQQTANSWHLGAIALSLTLLFVTVVDTYFLTPQMSAVGLNLSLFQTVPEIPTTMNVLHGGYWLLEAVKLVCGGTLLTWCMKQVFGVLNP
ncbi:MAG: hypothetical protein VKL59_08700 [Nostocaceae cyanobacterium]|nr:hypothetical protein [Nostocaceae cyanobacterium]